MNARGRDKLRRAIGHLRAYADSRETADEREPLLLSCSVMKFIIDGWHVCPWRTAFVYRYGRHPEDLIPFWLRRAAEHKTLAIIPDYDPTMEPTTGLRGPAAGGRTVYPMPPKERPAVEKPVLPMPARRSGT